MAPMLPRLPTRPTVKAHGENTNCLLKTPFPTRTSIVISAYLIVFNVFTIMA